MDHHAPIKHTHTAMQEHADDYQETYLLNSATKATKTREDVDESNDCQDQGSDGSFLVTLRGS